TFANGVFAPLTHRGFGHFDSDEFTGWSGEGGEPKDGARYANAPARLAGLASADQERSRKAGTHYGASGDPGARTRVGAATPRHHEQDFGPVTGWCANADRRPTPEGVGLFDDRGVRPNPLAPPAVPGAEAIDELYAAVVDGGPPLHDGVWSRATMEVCFAMLE